jgi:hypothetical protein
VICRTAERLTGAPGSCYRLGTITIEPEEIAMASRAKKSRKTSRAKTTSKRGGAGSKARGATSGRGAAKSRSGATKRVATASKAAAKRPAIEQVAKRPAVKKSSAKSRGAAESRKREGSSPLERVTRVAKEVAQQATTAVTEGVETLKDMGGTIVDRVTG